MKKCDTIIEDVQGTKLGKMKEIRPCASCHPLNGLRLIPGNWRAYERQICEQLLVTQPNKSKMEERKMGNLLNKLNMKSAQRMEPGDIYFILDTYRIFEGKNVDPKTGEPIKGVTVETDKGSRYLPNTIALEIVSEPKQFECMRHHYVRCTEFRNRYGTISKSLELLSDEEVSILFANGAENAQENK